MFRSSSTKAPKPPGAGIVASAASAMGISQPPPLPARLSIMEEMQHGEESLDEVKKEVNRANAGMAMDEDAKVSMSETVLYQVENVISTYPNSPFIFLLFFVVFCIVWQGIIWFYASATAHPDDDGADDAVFGYDSSLDSLYFTVMTVVTGGYEDEIPDVNGLRWIYLGQAFTNIVVVAVLIGFMNEAISGFMSSLSEGRTKVVEDGHTLILGWSEATIRVVIQLSFLRRQYQIMCEEQYPIVSFLCDWVPFLAFSRPLLRWSGMYDPPSTPLAAADIVIMNTLKTKEEMHELLERAMVERGIDPNRTRIGQNVVCRVGDPTNTNDLIRVGAHRAAAIITMMTERDIEESDLSNGKIENGATLRTCLALRHVMFAHSYNKENIVHPDLRVVLQMTTPSVYVDAACFKGPAGNDVILPMEITMFLNSLMFSCAAQPGLAKVILAILDFEGPAIRRRKARNLRAGPENKLGGAVGMTFKDLQHEYTRAVFVGIISPNMDKAAMQRTGYGLCPDPNHVIADSDMLIFIGPKSSPARDNDHRGISLDYLAKAKAIIAANRQKSTGVADVKHKKNVLVAGWRSVWSDNAERLRKRIMEIAHVREKGSYVIFINGVRSSPQDESNLDEMDERQASFAGIMSECGFRPLTNSENAKLPPVNYKRNVYEVCDKDNGNKPMGIFVSHIQGDAADPEIVEPVIIGRTIHTAIVLGTQAYSPLPAYSRDTRVLSIMLLLRKLWMSKNEGVPMHVVGENQQDMTARLALGPQVEFDGNGALKKNMHEPDFINSQAIYARILVQTMAYPAIRHAVMDLFDESPGSADLVIVKASAYVTLHTVHLWGVVQQCVLETPKERSICIGYIDGAGSAQVLPEHHMEHIYNENDRLVLLRRYVTDMPSGSAGADAGADSDDDDVQEQLNSKFASTRASSGNVKGPMLEKAVTRLSNI